MKKKEENQNKKVEIIVVLDRSGSMDSIKKQTIDGFNEFVDAQRDNGANTRITLVQFDHEYQMIYEAKKIGKVEPLNDHLYVPRGMTALLDAVGHTVKLTKKRFDHLKKGAPDKMIFVIITDGYENSSVKYTKEKVFKKVRKMEKDYGWEFVYLGANQDAIAEASRFGISGKRAMTFAGDEEGVKNMFGAVSFNVSYCLQNDAEFAFTEDQRKELER
jgi:Mg-chelatase subunit ChlD